MLTHLESVSVVVRELDSAVDHYNRLLGRAPSERGPTEFAAAGRALYQLENTSLQLLEAASEGLDGLCFGSADLLGCGELLRERGISALESPQSGGLRRTERRLVLPVSATRGTPVSIVAERPVPGDASASLAACDRASVRALDHVVLSSGDLEATKRLYEQQLQLRLALDRSFEQRGLRILFFRIAGVTLEIVGRPEETSDAQRPDRFGGLAWRVDDVLAAHRRLSAVGFVVSAHRGGHKPGTHVFTVKSDTHGVPTLIIGPAPIGEAG